jgi:hypothetical protein
MVRSELSLAKVLKNDSRLEDMEKLKPHWDKSHVFY